MSEVKIYTKGGDKGETGLADGSRVLKSSLRVETYGTVDELNANVGLLREQLGSAGVQVGVEISEYADHLFRIQNELFCICSELASPGGTVSGFTPLRAVAAERLEKEIDFFTAKLPPLRNFIIPGGSLLSAQAHVCRTVARRAERLLIRLDRGDAPQREEVLIYFNRLSDFLFVFSRMMNSICGVKELHWQK